MPLLETKTIKTPTLYKTDDKSAKQFKKVLDDLISERNELLQRQREAEARKKAIPNEIDNLKQELSRSLDSETRATLRESIKALEAERVEVEEVLWVNIQEVMMDKVTDSGVYDLQEQAKAEHRKWFAELIPYEEALREAYHATVSELVNIKEHNIYKRSSMQLDDLERYLRK